jgi:LysM repeat protein
MSSHRKPRLFSARKRARAVTLCAATIGAAAMPALAQAATSGSNATAAVAVHPKTTAHVAGAVVRTAALQAAKAAGTGTVVAVSDTTGTSSSSSSSGKTYTVVSGDTLSGIAERELGNGDKYSEIFSANKDKSESDGRTFTDPNLIYPGWTLEIPTASATESSSGSSGSSDSDSDSSGSSGSSSSGGGSSSASADSASSSSSSSSSSTSYADNLDGWINQAISILNANGYSVSYNAIYETAMNESSGNPNAENNSDSNAANGNPSKGLMQTTQTTFDYYTLSGHNDIWNPVDNIIAAAIYAQDTYGGLDNVVSARCGGSCWYGY